MYEYTKNWFLTSEIRHKLLKMINVNQKFNILEIGCYEGLSACFFSDNLLNDKESTLDCVDPFFDSGTVDGITSEFVDINTYNRFKKNISNSKNSNKITFHKKTSDDFFKDNKKSFNFIYIDGCHEPDYITRDMENSFKVLNKNGVMWMDDYGGGDGIRQRNTMNKFLIKYEGQYKLVHIGYQLAIQKI